VHVNDGLCCDYLRAPDLLDDQDADALQVKLNRNLCSVDGLGRVYCGRLDFRIGQPWIIPSDGGADDFGKLPPSRSSGSLALISI